MPKLANVLNEAIAEGLALLFPRLCPACGCWLPGRQSVCRLCLDDLERGASLAKPDANLLRLRMGGDVFSHAAACFEFRKGGTVQRLIHAMKYEGRPDIGRDLGRFFGEELRGTDWWRGYAGIVPVPLHAKRKAKRGYNQSQALAEGLRETIGLPIFNRLIVRVRNTPSQTGLNRTQRQENVKDAFRCPKPVAGDFLLLDDVVTTGATLNAAASAIRDSGAGRLGLIVLADALPA